MFKNEETNNEIDLIHPKLKEILETMGEYCANHGRELVVTDLLSSPVDDARLGRVSHSHQTGRAADVSIKNWPEEFIEQFKEVLTKSFGRIGAFSASDEKRRIVVDHVGTARHLHIQIDRRFTVKPRRKV